MSVVDFQTRVAKMLLDLLGRDGFALAGSGAIREHGLIDRPTEDIDLFTVREYSATFSRDLDLAAELLRGAGYKVEILRQSGEYARLLVTEPCSGQLTVDLGVDWRANSPVMLEVGRVLSRDDAVFSKVVALYSRGEARDYLDVDAIRETKLYTDEQLITGAKGLDVGFNTQWFAARLLDGRKLSVAQVCQYGYDKAELAAALQRLSQWAYALKSESEG